MQKLIPFLVITILLTFPSLSFATEFDVEAATRGYVDQLKGEALERSNSYFEGGYWLLLWGTLIAALADWIFLKFRWSARIRDWTERVTKRKWLQPALYVVPYAIIGTIITLPWMIYTSYFREKSYGFVNQTFGGWFSEQLIGMAIGVLSFMIFAMIIFAVIRRFPKNWWIIGSAVSTLLIFLMVMIAPVYLAPIFNDYTEMEAGPLKDEIVAMAKAHDVPSENIFVFNQSKQHDRISANVSGFGKTMRISLNDNLLNNGTPEEVKAVMGHEIGHYVLGHVWRNVLALSFIMLIGFFVLSRMVPYLIRKYGEKWGVRSASDIAAIPIYGIVLTLYGLLATPFTNSLIRMNEIEADAFGLETAQEPDGFASVAMKLSAYRKIEPGALEEMIFFTHPSGANRVRRAMEWKAKNLKKE